MSVQPDMFRQKLTGFHQQRLPNALTMIGWGNIQAVHEITLNGKKAKGNAIPFIDPDLALSHNDPLKVLTRIFKRMPHARHKAGHGNCLCLKPQARNIVKIFGLV
jgi:hypothetical protein